MLQDKLIDSITIEDIRSLIENQVKESRTLEYKRQLPGKSDSDKQKFLSSVTAFANASGGDIVYGIAESDGLPSEVMPITDWTDGEKTRLENILRDSVSPRLASYEIRDIKIDGGWVLVLRVGQSWSKPHAVMHGDSFRYYMRNNSGKYPMNVDEARRAIHLADEVPQRIRKLRAERIERIREGKTPLSVRSGPKVVVHIFPFQSVSEPNRIDVNDLQRHYRELQRECANDWEFSVEETNGEGYIGRTNCGQHNANTGELGYVQFFRSGAVEYVMQQLHPDPRHESSSEMEFSGPGMELCIFTTVRWFLETMSRLNLSYPVMVAIALVGVRGYVIKGYSNPVTPKPKFPDDSVIPPDIVFNERPDCVAKAMKSCVDVFWNGCDYPGSPNYDADGNWKKSGQVVTF